MIVVRASARRAATACVIVALLQACGFPEQDEARQLSGDQLPQALRPDVTQRTAVETPTERVALWLVQGDVLVPRRYEVGAPATLNDTILALLDGPSSADRAAGLRSALPEADVVETVSVERGIGTVALSADFGEISPDDQLLAVGQIVLTSTDFRGVGSVAFVREGKPIAVPLPTGETADRPVFREEYLPLTAATPTSA